MFRDWGKTKQGPEADDLFKKGSEKFEQSLEITPDKHKVLNSLGVVLSERAKTNSGEEADTLFQQAAERFEQASGVTTDRQKVLHVWGLMLSDWARTKIGAEADALFKQASDKFKQALSIKPDDFGSMFDLACLNALQHNIAESIRWLRRWKDTTPTASALDLQSDSDFDKIRSEPEFVQFVNDLTQL